MSGHCGPDAQVRASGGSCRGLVRRSDPIVLTPAGKVRVCSRTDRRLSPASFACCCDTLAIAAERDARCAARSHGAGCSARPRPPYGSGTTRSSTETMRWLRKSEIHPSPSCICASCSAGAAQAPLGAEDRDGLRTRECRGTRGWKPKGAALCA
eukprot:COSAG02_NODE_408_length_22892_cov_35.212785_11_plen_154_part_00